ncbi:MAG: alpha/beta hydrolase [Dehalococcoidia bacterium]|nr:alpha/beta hydrolase [Dehalococcoidia bacterium]MDD5494183.1 alpha/beta hydrolase [Dehalococcoidia bacterium]
MKIGNLEFNVKIIGDGAPFVWAHGLMCSMGWEDGSGIFGWDQIAAAARVVRYDARGHGHSGGSLNAADYRWINLGRDLLNIADACGINEFVAGGQSMGSATALSAAMLSPERVKALVLYTPPAIWETRTNQAAIYSLIAKIADEKGSRDMSRQMRQAPERTFPRWLLESLSSRVNVFWDGIAGFNKEVLVNVLGGSAQSNLPPREEVASMKIPVLILAWPDDIVHPLQSAYSLHEVLPQSELVMAENMDDVRQWPGRIKEFILKNG